MKMLKSRIRKVSPNFRLIFKNSKYAKKSFSIAYEFFFKLLTVTNESTMSLPWPDRIDLIN